LVSAEQVERAEPYIMFYQRVPSKGSRLDRQTFKQDMRRMEDQIREYLLSAALASPSSSSRPARSQDREEGANVTSLPQLSVQAVAEEMRYYGPSLRKLYRNPPKELELAFVSKHWYVRLTTMSHPGPIDNHEYLWGPDQRLGFSSAELAAEPFIPISRSLFRSLISKYGGGPEISSLDICPKCQTYISAYNVRKQHEFDLVSKYDTKDTGEGKGWYLVDANWVNNWKRYVKGESVTDMRELCAPGPVTNERLFDKESGRLREKLRLRLDYIGVNARVWWLFMHFHGGGPAIVRDDLDMYSEDSPLETELQPEELRPVAGSDFFMLTSRRFVDECRGDEQLYLQLFEGRRSTEGSAKPIEVTPAAPEQMEEKDACQELPESSEQIQSDLPAETLT